MTTTYEYTYILLEHESFERDESGELSTVSLEDKVRVLIGFGYRPLWDLTREKGKASLLMVHETTL
jgi:hypothetical protein